MTAIDPSLAGTDFEQLLNRAVKAFASDVSYTTSIVTTARVILKKRNTWALRSELRAAEKKARALCSQAGPFSCYTQSPCGVGSCKFAQGDLTLLQVPKCSGKSVRPQENSTGGDYSVEHALIPLSLMRSSREG